MLKKTNHNRNLTVSANLLLAFSLWIIPTHNLHAAGGSKPNARTQEIARYWTPERRAQAIPRDMVIDPRGLGYLRKPDGTLTPYGHDISAQKASSGGITALAKPSGSTDTAAPSITDQNPTAGAVVGASCTLSATVTDSGSGIKSVVFYLQKSGGLAQSFTASGAGDTYSVNLSGLTDGNWSWWVVAKDNGPKGGNTAISPAINFSVNTGSSGAGGGSGASSAITNAEWTGEGIVQTAAGRLYFQMPKNNARTAWSGYVCSGTVASDLQTDRSIIITASHCVYDDAHKAFARNVLFIPDQAGTSGAGTDLDCSNDPVGCWAPSFGIVDVNWSTRTFPDNIAWDYAYYVVSNSSAHTSSPTGLTGSYNSSALDSVAGSLTVNFAPPVINAVTTALGYSYSNDPKLMYCQEEVMEEPVDGVDWWLANCGLSGGASGGPWLQPLNSGEGDIISVNSWGYTNQPGMAGPKLSGTSAECLLNTAGSIKFFTASDGNEGITVNPPTDCYP